MQSGKRLVWAWLVAIAVAASLAHGQGPGGDPPGGEKLPKPKLKKPKPKPTPEKPAPEKEPAEKEKAEEEEEEAPPRKHPCGPLGDSTFIIVMLGVLVLMFVLTSRGKRKQAARKREMLSALKKGDKITTIGGVVGTVMEVREDEVTVKVDETNNIRLRFARWAIRGIGETAKTETPEDKR